MREIKIDQAALEGARKQFCLDTCLSWQQYKEHPGKKCYIQKTIYEESFSGFPGARKYAGTDSFFKAIVCMGQLFLAVDEKIYDWAAEKFLNCEPEWFCEFENLRMIDEKLREYGRKLGDTHVYFLPGQEGAGDAPADSEHFWKQGFPKLCTSWYDDQELLLFKEKNRFRRAICFSPTQPDMLAVAAMKEGTPEKSFDQGQMAGMAGVSRDGEYLWQVGIDVIPEYAGRGLASDLVRSLKDEVLKRGKIPFYGTSESHIISQTVALKSGFVPAWTELYVKPVQGTSVTEE